MNPKTIADRIKLTMDAKQLTVKALSDKVGLRPATVYQWLRAESTPSSDLLPKLASGLEVSTDFLLGTITHGALDSRSIVVKESSAIYLRNQGIGPSHPEYELYERLARLPSAPTDVKGWESFGAEVIPTIKDHASQQRKRERVLARQKKRTKGVIVPIRSRSSRSRAE